MRPSVVVGRRGVDLPGPVITGLEELHLPLVVLGVYPGDLGGMGSRLDCVLLGGLPERVPSHGMKDIEPLHLLLTADNIGGNVVPAVPHRQTRPGGIGKVVKAVEVLPVGIAAGPVQVDLLPERGPFALEILEIIGIHHQALSECCWGGIYKTLKPRRG